MHHSATLYKYSHLTVTCKLAAQVRQRLLCLDNTWIYAFSKKIKKKPKVYTLSLCSLNCKTPTIMQAYVLQPSPHINLEPHITAFTVFDPGDKQLSFSHITSCIKVDIIGQL